MKSRTHYSIKEVAEMKDCSEDDVFQQIQALRLQPSVYFDNVKCYVATSAMDLDFPSNAPVKSYSGLVQPMIFEEYCISTLNPGRSHEWKCDLEGQCVVYPHVADHDTNGDEVRRFLYPVETMIITAKDLLVSRETLRRFESRMNKTSPHAVNDDTPNEQRTLTMNFPLLKQYTFDELATRWRVSTDLIASYVETKQLKQAFRVMDGDKHTAWIDGRLDHLSTGPVIGPFILDEEVERWENLYLPPSIIKDTTTEQPTRGTYNISADAMREASQKLIAQRMAERDKYVDEIMAAINTEVRKVCAERGLDRMINHIRFIKEASVPVDRFDSVKKEVAKRILNDYGDAGFISLSRAPRKGIEPYFLPMPK